MKPFKLLAALCCIGLVISCKKEKKDDTPGGQFIGLWVESGAKKDTLVVTEGENPGIAGPMLFLHSNGVTYPFQYRFNNSQDSIILTDMTASSTLRHNVPYKIVFQQNQFTIKKFHAVLPETDPLTFYKVR